MSKNFECEMNFDFWGVLSLWVTRNGCQSSNIEVRDVDEAKKMIAVLQEWVQQQTTDNTNYTDEIVESDDLCMYCVEKQCTVFNCDEQYSGFKGRKLRV